MSQENVEIVRRWFDLFREADARRPSAMSTPRLRLAKEPNFPVPTPTSVTRGSRRRMTHWASEWAELRVEREELIDAGSAVVAATRHHGIGRASGATVETVVAYVVTVDDGKVVRLNIFNTKLQALEAVGLSE
jgi:ketosteroid isomerase-like protein